MPQPITNEKVEALVAVFENKLATTEQVKQAVQQLVQADLTTAQASEVVSTPQVLANITNDDAEALFAEIVLNELTDEIALVIVEKVQDAPKGVRKAFEKELNVFDGKTDTYVPLDSTIPISGRRVLIAATAIVIAMPTSTPQSHSRRKTV